MLLSTINQATRYSAEEARDIAARNTDDEYDGWAYVARQVGYWEWGVAVFDEDDEFLGYL